MRHEVDDGRETGVEIALRVDERLELAVLQRLIESDGARTVGPDAGTAGGDERAAVHDVEVRVDQAGQHRDPTQVDGSSAGRNRGTRANVDNPVTADDDHLIGQHRAGARIEQPSGSNSDDLRRRILPHRRWDPRGREGRDSTLRLRTKPRR